MLRLFFIWVVFLLGGVSSTFAEPPKKLLLVGQGPDGHPKQTHEYMAGVTIVEKCLKPVAGIEITTVKADGPWKEGPELMERADAVVLFVSEGAKWLQLEPKRIEALQKLAKRGGGLVVLHWGMGCKDAQYIEPFVQLFGGCHGGPDRKYAVVQTELLPVSAKHPVLTGIGPLKLKEEFYYQLKFVETEKGFQPLLQANISGKKETVSWAWDRPDGGRSFGFSGLHFHENWNKIEYRRLIAQAALWALKAPIPEKGLPVEVREEDLKVE
jgi:type 1 glutamine amidotransferase